MDPPPSSSSKPPPQPTRRQKEFSSSSSSSSSSTADKSISSWKWRLFFLGYVGGFGSASLFTQSRGEFACFPTEETDLKAGGGWTSAGERQWEASALKKLDGVNSTAAGRVQEAEKSETTPAATAATNGYSWEDLQLPFQPEMTKGKFDMLLLTNEDLVRSPPIPDIAKAGPSIKPALDRVFQKGAYAHHAIGMRHAWIAGMWGRNANHICPDFADVRSYAEMRGKAKSMYNVWYSSAGLFGNANVGQGNWITSFYDMRLKAVEMGFDLMISADDAEESKTSHVLPWLNGYFPARNNASSEDGFDFPAPHPPGGVDARGDPQCGGGYDRTRISTMAPAIRRDLRRLAISVAGIPHRGHPAEAWAEERLWSSGASRFPSPNDVMQLPDPARGDEPLVPGLELDETALHFRCDDLMSTNHPSFGFVKFAAYSRRIDPSTKSIGIVTNPFDDEAQNRGSSGRKAAAREACRTVAAALRDFLSEQFPKARVSIRNGVNETVVTSYTRLIMATTTISGLSSFGIFPAVASFGRGYIQKPNYRKAPNNWALSLEGMYDDVILFEESKRLSAKQASSMKTNDMDKMLEWFRNDELDIR